MIQFSCRAYRTTIFLITGKGAFINRLAGRAALFWPLLFSALIFQGTASAALNAGFIEAPVGGSWDAAVGLTFDAGGRMYVWEKGGKVWILENDVRLANPLLDISEEVGNWRDHGLLGFALSENFLNNGYIYLMYVVDRHYLLNCTEHPSGIGVPQCDLQLYSPSTNNYLSATIGRITRYTAIKPAGDTDFTNAISIDPNSRKVLVGESIETGIPILHSSHGVGSLVFGADGTLLASVGDTAGFNGVDSGQGSGESFYAAQGLVDKIITSNHDVGAFRAQLVDSLNGKLLRLDAETGDGLATNPFYDANDPRSARSRVWALGLRNPFRFNHRPETGSHNPADGDPGSFYIGDVGYFTWEDLNVSNKPGMNFGWPIFEGLTFKNAYKNADTPNMDAPNPLYEIGGCTQQYFYFQDLIQQATLSPNVSFPNPCNAGQEIPSSINVFLHDRPALDWGHDTGQARTGIFVGNTAAEISVDDPASPVTGESFDGSSSTGGTFYEGNNFPPEYIGTYFHGDYVGQWIKNFQFDQNDQPLAVDGFLDSGGGIVAMNAHPINGALYYISWAIAVNKITYIGTDNRPPEAAIELDKKFDTDGSPLTVQFTGSLSSDPEGGPLTYLWNFGDGSTSTEANPLHTFTAPGGVPTQYDIALTVTDQSSAASQPATAIVSVNNTPPTADITSPTAGSLYTMAGDSTYNLTADISDAEQGPGGLSCAWLTALHHNNHKHDEPLDNSCSTTVTVSPAGCDGNTYFYRHTLTVTDNAGLSVVKDVSVYPDCSGGTPPTLSINDVSVVENAGNAVFTVSLASVTGDPVSVDFTTLNGTAMAGSDYSAVNGSLTFAVGDTEKSITVPVQDDFQIEGNEVFSIELSSAVNAVLTDSVGSATIVDNEINVCGGPGYDSNTDREVFLWKDCANGNWNSRFTAGGGYARYQGDVTSNMPFTEVTPFSVEGADVVDSSDPSTISFQLQMSPPYEDGIGFGFPAAANVCFGLTTPAGAFVLVGPDSTPVAVPFDLGTLGPCITSAEPILSVSDTTIAEGAGSALITVSLTPGASDEVSVDYAAIEGSALAGVDFITANGTVTFAVGETTQSFSIAIQDDSENEGNENFGIELTNPLNAVIGVANASVTITDDEVSVCGAPVYSKIVDRAAFVWRDCSSGIWKVRLTAGGGYTRYVGLIASNQAFSTIIPVSQEGTDSFDTSNPVEISYGLQMSPPYEDGFDFGYPAGSSVCFAINSPLDAMVLLGPGRTPVSIPFDMETLGPCGVAEPTLSISDRLVAEHEGITSVVVNLSPVSTQTVTVNYATANGNALAGQDYTQTSGTLSFNAGDSLASIDISILDDLDTESTEQFTVSLSGPVNAPLGDASATVTIFDDEVSVCGPPTINLNSDTGMYLWKDCGTGDWIARFLSGGSFTQYTGMVDSSQPFDGFAPYSIEPLDQLNYSNGDSTIGFTLYVSPPYQDGFTFRPATGSNSCFDIATPGGAAVFVGPDRAPAPVPFNPETLGPCQ